MTAWIGAANNLDLMDFGYHSPEVLPRIVWLRSKSVSYTAEIMSDLLLPNGKINRKDLAEFTWEPWPGEGC